MVDGRRQRTVTSRAAILDAAEHLFSTEGFHSTSMRSIASEIGMSHPGVLRHFDSKSAVLAAILARFEERNSDYTAQLSHLSPDEQVLEVGRFLLAHPATVQVSIALLGDAAESDHPQHDFVVGLLHRVEAPLAEAGPEANSTWNGLELVWLYVPDLLDPARAIQSYFRSMHLPASEHPDADVRAAPKYNERTSPTSREGEIVAAASAAFARHGYRATGLREIAAELGLSHGALLYHFPTKVDLLKAVLEERDRDEGLPWSIGSTPLDYLHGMYLQALHNQSHPELSRLFSTLVCEATDPEHPAHRYFADRYARFHGELRDVLEALVFDGLARPDIDVDIEAWLLIALWDGLALRGLYLDDEIGLPERLRARLNSLLNVKLNHASITTIDQLVTHS